MTPESERPRDRAWLDVSLSNLLENARAAQTAGGGSPLLPVVKANAYGLGVGPVVEALEQLAPWGYAVATVGEGTELRERGVTRPILVFTPAQCEQLELYREHDLRAVLDEPATVDRWTLPFHLEIDTGMGRCGLRFDDGRLSKLSSHHMEGAFTHFFAADERPETVSEQWNRFTAALARLPTPPRIAHAANSAGAWRLAERLDLVRPGIYLYGGTCGPDLPSPLPVVTFRAPVVSVRSLPKGATVSYGGDWSAPADTVIATLGAGYADGIRRSVQGRAEVILCGRRCPVVGRVTMDFIMVDLGGAEHRVSPGDIGVVIGSATGDEISVDDFARWAGTISYEILTGLGARVPRYYDSSV